MYRSIALLALMVSLFAGPAFAQDSGWFYDPARPGEGLDVVRNGDQIFFKMYTFNSCPEISQLPSVGPTIADEEVCRVRPRYFMNFGDTLEDDFEVSGFLYTTVPLNFPNGIPIPGNPFARQVAEPVVVGLFVMHRAGDEKNPGWRLIVLPFGGYWPEYDHLFSGVFDFTLLLKGVDEKD